MCYTENVNTVPKLDHLQWRALLVFGNIYSVNMWLPEHYHMVLHQPILETLHDLLK